MCLITLPAHIYVCVRACAQAWAVWEGRTSKLIPDPAYSSTYEEDKFAIAFARIENHYFVNSEYSQGLGSRAVHSN